MNKTFCFCLWPPDDTETKSIAKVQNVIATGADVHSAFATIVGKLPDGKRVFTWTEISPTDSDAGEWGIKW